MVATLAKYRHVFNVGLQSNIVYRWNFALRSFFSLFHLVVVFILWGAAFATNPTIGGFTLKQTLTYFVVLFVVGFFVGAFNEDYQISEEIRNGLINQFLLKPVNYFAYRFSIFVGARIVSGTVAIVAVLASLPLTYWALVMPGEGWRYAMAVPAICLSAMIQFSIAYCFGLLTFWFLEIQGFVILSMAIETVLGGQVFPLDLMPRSIFVVAQYLPFAYQAYFPTAILTGRVDHEYAVRGLLIQLFWAIVLLFVNQLVWRRGLRRHTAVGG
jgi:ABC-2 type transport system permease protein